MPARGRAPRRGRRFAWLAPRTTVRTVDGVLEVTATCPPFFALICAVDYVVEVPPAATVEVRADVGAVSVRGVEAALDLRTEVGDVTVAKAARPVRVRTSTGDVSATGLGSGRVSAVTAVADVLVDALTAPETVEARADVGDVTVRVPDGTYDVDASAGVGHVRIGVRTAVASPRRITAGTGVGDVDVGAR